LAIEQGIGGKHPFSQEQETAIKTATGESGVAVIQGRAGVGKSTMLAAVNESYKQEGWKVQGIAFSGQAAQNLEKESGIESKTIHSWLSQKDIDNRTVVIIDEAGMVGSKQMADVINKVEKAQAKLILVGDERQLQPIAAGGIFHAVDQKIAQLAPQFSTVVEDIKRQREGWMKEVVKEAAQGHTIKALETLDEHKKINVYENASQARTALVEEFIEKNRHDLSRGMILTNRAFDAQIINEEIREKLQEQGLVDKDGISFDNEKRNITLSKGDRIIFTRNDYDLEVRNGQKATVDYVTPSGIIGVAYDDGDRQKIDVHEYNHIDYGWATTTHKAQGATVDRTIVYGYAKESMASQQATYVQISRAREETKLYIVAGERGLEREEVSQKLDVGQRKEVMEEMKKGWSHNAAKDTTLEYAQLKQKQVIKNELKQERGYELGM
jgi:ATP-dependent exoDNAse (exonuclease V) alpha subunit